MQLKEAFPHDRVLERMTKDELAKIKGLRRPEEYNLANQEEDYASKVFEKTPVKK